MKDALPPPLRADRLAPCGIGELSVPLDVVKEAVRVIVPLTIPSYILTEIPRETSAFTLSLLSLVPVKEYFVTVTEIGILSPEPESKSLI